MLKTLTIAGGLLLAGLALAPGQAVAAPMSGLSLTETAPLVEAVQYGYRERGYGRGYGPRPGRVVRRIFGGGPRFRDRGYRGRGYGYGRRYDRY